jgi:hypothetical protein
MLQCYLGFEQKKIIFFGHYPGGGYKKFHYPTTTKTEDTSEAQPKSPLDSAQKLNIRENLVVQWKSSS